MANDETAVLGEKISELPTTPLVRPGYDTVPLVSGGLTYSTSVQLLTNAALKAPGPIGGMTPNSATFTTVHAATATFATPLGEKSGGTAQTGYARGDLLFASGDDKLERLPIGDESGILRVLNGLPSWDDESGPVTSVNGKTGDVTLDAGDVGAYSKEESDERFSPNPIQPATTTAIGGIIVGDNLSVQPDGRLSANGQGGVPFGTVGQLAYWEKNGVQVDGTPWANIQNAKLVLGGGGGDTPRAGGSIALQDKSGGNVFEINNVSGADYAISFGGIPPKPGDVPYVVQKTESGATINFMPPKVVVGVAGYGKLGVVQFKLGTGLGVDQEGVAQLIPAFNYEVGGVRVRKGNTGITIDEGDATIRLQTAGETSIGGIILGKHLQQVDSNGRVDVDFDPYTLPPATAGELGGVKIGSGVNVSADGTISVSSPPVDPALPRNRAVFMGAFNDDVSVQWSVPTGCRVFRVTVVGCGGSSGFARGSGLKTGASGGGGGGWAIETFFDYDVGTTFDLFLGASNAVNPQSTSFSLAGKRFIYATNGAGGRDAVTDKDFVVGGIGGIGYQVNADPTHMTGKALTGSGGTGGYAFGLPSGTTFGGASGASLFGGASQYLIGSSLPPGCGAPGGGSVQGFDYGITGMPGIIIIEW
jgi:hypothetical protein